MKNIIDVFLALLNDPVVRILLIVFLMLCIIVLFL